MAKRKRKQKMNPWVLVSIIIVAILVVNNYTSSSSRESSPVQITARYYDANGNLIGTSGRGFSLQSIISPGIEDVEPEAVEVELIASVVNTGNTITTYEVTSIDFEGQTYNSVTGSTAVPVGAEAQFTSERIDVDDFVGDSQINLNIEGSVGDDSVSDVYSWRFSKLKEALGFFGLMQSFLTNDPENVLVYDDFDSYSLGEFDGGSKWTIVAYEPSNPTYSAYTYAGGEIVSSNNAGGDSKELSLYATDNGGAGPYGPHVTITSTSLLPNRHTYVKYKLGNPNSYCRVYYQSISFGNSVDGFTDIFYEAFTNGCAEGELTRYDPANSITILAKGNNQYDLYHAGKFISSESYSQDPQLKIYNKIVRDGSDTLNLYVDDISQSVEVVE